MNLIIDQDGSENLNAFCEIIIKHIQETLPNMLDESRLAPFDEYINTDLKIKFRTTARILSSRELLIASTYNLRYRKHSNSYIIKINPNVYVYDTSIKIIDIIKLINYGNLILAPYPIYDKIMDNNADNLNQLYRDYKDSE